MSRRPLATVDTLPRRHQDFWLVWICVLILVLAILAWEPPLRANWQYLVAVWMTWGAIEITKIWNVCRAYRRKRREIPEPLSPTIRERLQHLGANQEAQLQTWREFAWRGGDVEAELATREKCLAEFEVWRHKSLEYVRECRRRSPPPALESFSPLERAQREVLLTQFQKFDSRDGEWVCTPSNSEWIWVVRTDPFTLDLALQGFSPYDHIVVLTDQEWQEWYTLRPPVDFEHEFLWCGDIWWLWTDRLRDSLETYGWEKDFPPGAGRLYLDHGILWGSMAGGGEIEAWTWDDSNLTFQQTVADWVA